MFLNTASTSVCLFSLIAYIGLELIYISPSQASSVRAASDGTGTRVEHNGNTFNVHDGSLSGDEANLFHSFEQFGLDAHQVANFLSSSDIRNILARVMGGDASFIDGVIRSTGSNANLYLINPYGIVFGENARLDLRGSFTATTATGVGFDEDIWFNTLGDNEYQNLVGTPHIFTFDVNQPGSIVNAGQLSVLQEQNLMLLGGNIINTGQLTAPSGNIIVTAVPGTSRVRISQPGHLLSLEVETSPSSNLSIDPYDLAHLLTTGNTTSDLGITVDAENTARLSAVDESLPIESQTSLISGDLNVAGSSRGQTGGSIAVLGTHVVTVDAHVDASGDRGGGSIWIGGEYRGRDTLPSASSTFIDQNSVIRADSVQRGDGGRIIVWADNTTQYEGSIWARGGERSGNGGFVEVSGRDTLIFRGDADVSANHGRVGEILLDPENIIIVDGRGGTNDAEVTGDGEILTNEGGTRFTISERILERLVGDVRLEASDNIRIRDLSDNRLTFTNSVSSVTLEADTNRDGIGSISMNRGDTISVSRGSLTLSGATLSLGSIEAGGTIQLIGDEIDLVSARPINDDASNINILDTISFQPRTSGQRIVLGGTNNDSSALNLTIQDLNAIQDGFGSIRIGQFSGGSSNISTVGTDEIVFQDDLILNANTGNISINAPILVESGGSIDLAADSINIGRSGSIQADSVSISPGSSQRNVLIGGSRPDNENTLVITQAELEAFSPSGERFRSFTIGSNSRGSNANINRLIIRSRLEADSVDFQADEIDLQGGSGSIRANSVTLRPITPTQNTRVGDRRDTGLDNILDITLTDLAALALPDDSFFDYFSELIISSGSIGTLTVRELPESSFIQLQGGEINLIGGQNSVRTSSISLGSGTIDQDIFVGGGRDRGDDTLDITISDLRAITPLNGTSLSRIEIFGNQGILTVRAPLTASSSIRLVSDEINLIGEPNSIRAERIELSTPFSFQNVPDQSILIGQTNDSGLLDTLDITQSDLRAIRPEGFIPQLVVQSEFGFGNGNITISGANPLTLGNSLSLDTGGNIAITQELQVNGNLTTNSDSPFFTQSTVADSTVSITAPLNVSGTLDISGSNLSEVSIADALNVGRDFNVSGSSSTAVSLADTVDVGGNFNVSRASLSVGGDITAGGQINFGGTITLNGTTRFRSSAINFPGTITGGENASLLLSASDAITTGRITTQGTNVRIELNGSLTLLSDISTNGGDFTATSPETVSVASSVQTLGGDITLSGTDVEANAANLDSSNPTGQGGEISLTATTGAVSSGDLNSSGSVGGSIIVRASEAITTGAINASGSVGNGGTVLLDPQGDIQVSSINAQGGAAGVGGNIDITTERFFRATDTFVDQNGLAASISTAGGEGGGSIIIRHGGGLEATPFVVGDATENGTAGVITTEADNFIVPLASFSESFSQGIPPSDIQILTQTFGPPEEEVLTPLPEAGSFSELLEATQNALQRIQQETGVNPALIYVRFVDSTGLTFAQAEIGSREDFDSLQHSEVLIDEENRTHSAEGGNINGTINVEESEDEEQHLEVLLVTANDEPVRRIVPDAEYNNVLNTADRFTYSLRDKDEEDDYIEYAQDLYDWLVHPLKAELEAQGINNLSFILDEGLRSVPIAALHDRNADQFLIEQGYSLGLMPSFTLTDTRYQSLRNVRMLAMGATFSGRNDVREIEKVEEELNNIAFSSDVVLTESNFTFEQLREQRENQEFGIVHLATHARFGETPENSAIYFWDTVLRLSEVDKLRALNLYDPPLELLVLSACETLTGDKRAELGFAGLSAQLGVKSVLASLWKVNDAGTSLLMTEFYRQIRPLELTGSQQSDQRSDAVTIKAEALRRAQLSLLNSEEFSHPYHWSAFTIVGSPW
jgi:filamentous hemagglutinin family protein